MQSLALTFDSKMGMRDCIKRLADVNANSIHCHVLIHRACHFVTGSSQVCRHDFPLFNLFLITFLFFGCLEVAFRTCSIKLQGSKVGWPGCHSPDHPSCLFRKVTWYIPLSVTRDLMQLPQFFTDDGDQSYSDIFLQSGLYLSPGGRWTFNEREIESWEECI